MQRNQKSEISQYLLDVTQKLFPIKKNIAAMALDMIMCQRAAETILIFHRISYLV